MKTYSGSCHCGAVTFEADIDLARGTHKCNCSYCRKARNWIVLTKPDHVRVTSGDAAISTYIGQKGGHYQFCAKCGIRLWTKGDFPGYGPFQNVFVPVLNAPDEALLAAPVTWMDLANDDWKNPPARVDHY